MKKIFICDENKTDLAITCGILQQNNISFSAFSSAKNALDCLEKNEEDFSMGIIATEMSTTHGYSFLGKIQEREGFSDFPVLLLSSVRNFSDEFEAFQNGARDYMKKPVSPKVLMARVCSILKTEEAKEIIREHDKWLEAEVQMKTFELAALQKLTIFAMTSLCSERDQETGSHILRTQIYVRILSEELHYHPELIEKYAPLHDIGKVGIPDYILLKPGKLDASEFEVIKTHPIIGHRAIMGALERGNSHLRDLEFAAKIIRSHHERWDGKGYPDSLRGESIPFEARIMALADVYDALRSKRPYKEPFSHEKAKQIILEESGKQFDPRVVEAFLNNERKFADISCNLQTKDDELHGILQRMRNVRKVGFNCAV